MQTRQCPNNAAANNTGRMVRRYDPADWDAISRVHDRARLLELGLTVGRAAFRSLAETADSEGLFDGEILVADHEGLVTGFVAFTADEITWLYADPAHGRSGIGRMLLRHALATCIGTVETWVLAGNIPAIMLYRSEGFVLAETRIGHLEGDPTTPATGHLMRRAPDLA
ncbi:MAG: GNAT family N-acetyltransferase [Pseudomonadota bacterium]|uniref:GNAT family N-acetyltransferase n=1 Tax=Sphingomonas sp. ERG5 TaxID=1381597 RepID=UPI000ADF400D|nr:GNAT family N-acetyltransferase [Sphingomonas sp. ERG5]